LVNNAVGGGRFPSPRAPFYRWTKLALLLEPREWDSGETQEVFTDFGKCGNVTSRTAFTGL